jgi:alanyl-tRNA synthetase
MGTIETETGNGTVLDTRHAIQGLHGHMLRVQSGHIAVGQRAKAVIDSPRREAIRKSHTGTHVLHWALRDVLGHHANQAGSLVEPGRLRFDFSHFSQVAPEELADIEAEANERLIANDRVTTTVTSKEHALDMGALAFFGDKYGETVRVVQVGGYSTELCGGTHTHTSAQVGPLLIMSESSIGSNLRRVEALTGLSAYRRVVEMRASLDQAGRVLKVPGSDVPGRIEALLERLGTLEKDIETTRSQRRGELAADMAAAAIKVEDVSLVAATAPDLDVSALRQLALGVRDRLDGRSVIVIGAVHGGKGALVGLVSKDLVQAGISAAEIIGEAAAELGGGGSRDPELAQAGGPHGEKLDSAVDLARETAGRLLRGL